MTRHKMGDIHPDNGLIFVEYAKSCKNGEWWTTREKYDARLSIKKSSMKAKYHQDAEHRGNVLSRNRAWFRSDAGKQWDNQRKGTPRELAKRRKRESLRKLNDPAYRVTSRIRNKLLKVIKSGRMSRSYTVSQAIGICMDGLVRFIEAQFHDGMGWSNIGKWHIDHFVPMKFASNEKEAKALTHYTNLQPLWAKDNLKKGDKLPTPNEFHKRMNFTDDWQMQFQPASMGQVNTQNIQ